MIVDKIQNFSNYNGLKAKFQKAFTFLSDSNINLLDNGKYEIEGENVYALVSEYKTKDEFEGILEAHRKYIDIQFLAKGTELIGYVPFNDQELISEYNEEKDVALFKGDKSFITVEQGMFAVLFPNELHMPGIKSSQKELVKKVVVKVKA